MTLKNDFLQAVIDGELGQKTDFGIEVSLHDFRVYFKHIGSGYLTSFLPASVIENGQKSITRTRFLFRIKKGVYRLHPQVIDEFYQEKGISLIPAWQQKIQTKNIDFLSLKF